MRGSRKPPADGPRTAPPRAVGARLRAGKGEGKTGRQAGQRLRLLGGLAGWRAGGLAGWRAGGLAGWRAGGLAGWRALLQLNTARKPAGSPSKVPDPPRASGRTTASRKLNHNRLSLFAKTPAQRSTDIPTERAMDRVCLAPSLHQKSVKLQLISRIL